MAKIEIFGVVASALTGAWMSQPAVLREEDEVAFLNRGSEVLRREVHVWGGRRVGFETSFKEDDEGWLRMLECYENQ